jgi:hypothetical protein
MIPEIALRLELVFENHPPTIGLAFKTLMTFASLAKISQHLQFHPYRSNHA